VKGNSHAPFWSSGRRSDPPLDCDGTRPLVVLRKCSDPGQFAGFLSCRNSTELSNGRLQLLFGVAWVWRHAP